MAFFAVLARNQHMIIGANRGIANPEIISSFGPGTFWRRDEIPFCNFTIWAQVTYQQGKSQNSKCRLRGQIFAFALFLSMIGITDSYTYLLLVYLGDDAFETLWNFFLWHVSSFTQAIANMQCPFNNNIAFIDGGNLWALAVDIDRLYVTANLLMNVRTCFYWNQMTVAFVMCPPVLEDLFRQA